MKLHPWKIFLLIGLPITCLYLLRPNLVVETVLFRGLGMYACVGIMAGLHISHPHPRLGWVLLAIGALVTVIGDYFYTEMYYLQNPVLDPTAAELIYIVGLFSFLIGLAYILWTFHRLVTRDSLIDGLIIATGFVSLIWLIQIDPKLAQAHDLFEWLNITGIPFGLAFAISLWAVFLATPMGRIASYRLVFYASLSFVLAVYFQVQGTSGWPTPFVINSPSDYVYFSDMIFSLAYILIAVAFLHPSIQLLRNLPAKSKIMAQQDLRLMGIAFFITPVAFVFLSLRQQPVNAFFVILSNMIIFSLVLFRLTSLMRTLELKNQQLNQQRQDLHHMAFHDPLTGLPNRAFLDDYLEHAVQRATSNWLGAVLMIDVNHFKAVNDTFGHHVGDDVLREVAQCLEELKRRSDLVVRWGGDEFVFVIEGLQSTQDALVFARRLTSHVQISRSLDSLTVTTSLSIGICLFPTGGYDAQTILRHADSALYQAKADGENQVVLYCDAR